MNQETPFHKRLKEDIQNWERLHPGINILNPPPAPRWFTNTKIEEKKIIFPNWWYKEKNEETP